MTLINNINRPILTFEQYKDQKPTTGKIKVNLDTSTENIDLFAVHQQDVLKEDLRQDEDQESIQFRNMLNLKNVSQQRKLDPTLNLGLNKAIINDYKAKYIEVDELNVLMEFFKNDNILFKEIDSFLGEMVKFGDSQALMSLDKFLGAGKFNNAQIYMILNYIYDLLAKKFPRREQLRRSVLNVLKKFELQESAYLCNFFSILNHPEVKSNINLAEGLALVASGNIELGTVKQSLALVKKLTGNNLDNLVSSCMKHLASVLHSLTKKDDSFETKTALAEYINFEKSLIVINSTHLKIQKFKQQLTEHKNPVLLSEHNCNLLDGVINFSETALMNDNAIKNLYKQLGVNLMTISDGFPNQLIPLFDSLPMLVYNYINPQKQKIIEGLKNYVQNRTTKQTSKASFSSILKSELHDSDQSDIKYKI